jgi:hypothetical protein
MQNQILANGWLCARSRQSNDIDTDGVGGLQPQPELAFAVVGGSSEQLVEQSTALRFHFDRFEEDESLLRMETSSLMASGFTCRSRTGARPGRRGIFCRGSSHRTSGCPMAVQ